MILEPGGMDGVGSEMPHANPMVLAADHAPEAGEVALGLVGVDAVPAVGVGMGDALNRVEPWHGLGSEAFRQIVDLLDVEHGVGFQEGNGLLALFAGLSIGLDAGDAVGIDDAIALPEDDVAFHVKLERLLAALGHLRAAAAAEW